MVQGIRYISHFGPSGYGNAARNYLLGLRAADHPVTWTPMLGGFRRFPHHRPFTGRTVGDRQLDPICNQPLDYGTVLLHLLPEYIPIWRRAEPGKRLVGYCVWETDRLPAHWPPLLNQLDRLLVPCRWNQEMFHLSGVSVPIEIIPHIADPPCERTAQPFREAATEDFVFYTIGSWTNRKAIGNTLLCYWNTFRAEERVLLIIKTDRRDLTVTGLRRFCGSTRATVKRLRKKRGNLAPVLLMDREISAAAIATIHARGDCYVSLCRAEGWGFGAFQAAASGKPVIITGFGGQLDYLPPELAYLVDYRLVPVADPSGWPSYSGEQHWADPDREHASRLMRHAYENPEEARQKGEQLALHVAARFDRATVIQKLIAACTEDSR